MKGDPEQRAVQLGEYIVAHHATVRGAAQAFGCSKSTVHKDVSTRLRAVSPGLFAQVQAPKAGKDVMKLYQFSGIPYILVLDQEGRIVGKNLRDKALMDKLEEMVSGKKKESVAMPAMGM